MSETKKVDYLARVNRAIDYILRNLDQPLQLEPVAEVAGFSPFHFHRIFRSLTSETLNQFIKRVRLERAISILSHEPKAALTEVALECGFASSSDFSRSFKQRYGVPPSAFDVGTFRQGRREEWLAAVDPERTHKLDGLPPGENPDGFEVELVDLPARRVAYLRVYDPYRPDVVHAATQRFVKWADERGLADGQWLGYMWDDPDIVPHERCRYDVGLVVGDVRPEGEIGVLEFPPMRVAQIECRGTIDLELRALDWIFGTWLPESGNLTTDQPSFEAWIGRPFANGLETFELHVQIPIAR